MPERSDLFKGPKGPKGPLGPHGTFSGKTTTIGGKNVDLGQTFNLGKASPEVKKYSGEIIYIDNRAPVTRTASQKEEVKIVIEF